MEELRYYIYIKVSTVKDLFSWDFLRAAGITLFVIMLFAAAIFILALKVWHVAGLGADGSDNWVLLMLSFLSAVWLFMAAKEKSKEGR